MQTETITVGKTSLWMRKGGHGQPLLWLHGAGGAQWLPVHERLAEQFTVWVPDHPGFGRSADLDPLEGIDDLVFFYLDLLRQWDLSGVHVVGHSIGGWLAAELAVVEPAWMQSLSLIDAAGLMLPEVPIPDIFVLSPQERSQLTRAPQSPEASLELSDEAIRERSRNDNTVARLAWEPYLHDPKLQRRLYRIHIPTLLMWGAEDRLIAPAYAEVFHRAIAGSRLQWIANAGHAPHRDNPELVANLILQHCGGLAK